MARIYGFLELLLVGTPFILIGYGLAHPDILTKLISIFIGSSLLSTAYFFIFSTKGRQMTLKAGWYIGKAIQFCIIAYICSRHNLGVLRQSRRKF